MRLTNVWLIVPHVGGDLSRAISQKVLVTWRENTSEGGEGDEIGHYGMFIVAVPPAREVRMKGGGGSEGFGDDE